MAQTFVKVAKTVEIRPGQAKVVEVNRRSIAICNMDGEFYAIDNVCTHDGGHLDQGELQGKIIECPRHGARFDVTTGQDVAPPALGPEDTFKVRVQGHDIEVFED